MWELTINTTDTDITPGPTLNVWIVRGSGPKPLLVDLTPPPPPGDPADPPPDEPEDNSPFVFPTDGPRYQTRDFDRNYPLSATLPGADYYACEQDAGNPAIMSHANAGIIAHGGRTDYGRAVGDLRLWVRTVEGESMTGARLAPAPPRLIRRALAKGHL